MKTTTSDRRYLSGGDNVRRMLIAMVLLLVCPGLTFAAELMVKVPVKELQETQDKLEGMQAQIDELKQLIGQSQAEPEKSAEQGGGEMAPATGRTYSDKKLKKMERDISEIYDTLDEVETAALLDLVNFGAEVRVRMDNYRVKNYVGSYFDLNPFSSTYQSWVGASAADERNDSNWSSRFRVNMDSDVSKTIKFAGRLALRKNWADSTGVFMSTDNNRAHSSDGTTDLKVDRFYIDWTPEFYTPVSISFGRLPTSDGPPFEFKEDRQRQSIYPALIFDGEPDGIVVTAGLERYLDLKNSGLRYFYAMAVQYDEDQISMNYLDSVWKDTYDDNRVQALFFETEVPGFRDSLLVLSYVPAKNILMQSPYSAAGSAESVDNLGDINLYGIHIQVPNLWGSGLDVFASYAQNENEPNGNTIDYGGANFGLFSGAPSPMPNLAVDGAPTKSTTGKAAYAGVRYELPIISLNRPKIGLEYNRGNKYWFSFTPGTDDIFNRLATRGEAIDFYYLQPFNKNLYMRAGYTKITYDYTGSGMPFGQPLDYVKDLGMSEEPEFHNFYVLLDARF